MPASPTYVNVTDTTYPGHAFVGYLSQLLVGNGASPELFEAVADITEITPGEMSTAVVEKTHLRSPNAHKEKLAVLRDSGPFQLKGNWNPTSASQSNAGGGSGAFQNGGLMAMWIARSEHNFKITLSDEFETEWPFRGVVTKFQPGVIGTEQKVEFTAEITPIQDFSADLP
jgi:tail tube protein